ncbi:hypothetical protein [Clostridium sp.]|uniref:hypothetical protein n=1 Tax=Clostridium sp. TaxID=1506 RepID=UPI003D6D64FA
MKKTKVIASVIAMSMMFMGVAYAWTNPISISVAADTAVFSVDIINAGAPTASKLIDNLVSSISSDGKSMSFTAANLYPGAFAETVLTVKNTGTIDVKLTDMLLSSTEFQSSDLGSNVEITVLPKSTDANQSPMLSGWTSKLLLNQQGSSFFTDKTLTFDGTKTILVPNDTATIKINIKLKDSAPNITTEGEKFKFTIEPIFNIAN